MPHHAGDDPAERIRREQKRHMWGDAAGRVAGDCHGDTPVRLGLLRARAGAARRTSVRARVKDPLFRPLATIRPEELERVLKEVLDIFTEGNIHVDFAQDISGADRYRFLTETLPDLELPGADDEACVHYWLYRESPPNDVTEAIFSAEHFLEGLFQRATGLLLPFLGGFDRGTDDATRCRGVALKERCEHFIAGTVHVTGWSMTGVECSLQGDRAIVRSRVEWTGRDATSRARLSHAGACILHLVRCAYGGWDVIEMECPGVG